MVRNGLLIFNSVHKVMKAEKALRRAGLDVRIMPVPRKLSSDCGLSLAFRVEDFTSVVEALDESACQAEEIYRLDGEDYVVFG